MGDWVGRKLERERKLKQIRLNFITLKGDQGNNDLVQNCFRKKCPVYWGLRQSKDVRVREENRMRKKSE